MPDFPHFNYDLMNDVLEVFAKDEQFEGGIYHLCDALERPWREMSCQEQGEFWDTTGYMIWPNQILFGINGDWRKLTHGQCGFYLLKPRFKDWLTYKEVYNYNNEKSW